MERSKRDVRAIHGRLLTESTHSGAQGEVTRRSTTVWKPCTISGYLWCNQTHRRLRHTNAAGTEVVRPLQVGRLDASLPWEFAWCVSVPIPSQALTVSQPQTSKVQFSCCNLVTLRPTNANVASTVKPVKPNKLGPCHFCVNNRCAHVIRILCSIHQLRPKLPCVTRVLEITGLGGRSTG
jgi:hypothetical protein